MTNRFKVRIKLSIHLSFYWLRHSETLLKQHQTSGLLSSQECSDVDPSLWLDRLRRRKRRNTPEELRPVGWRRGTLEKRGVRRGGVESTEPKGRSSKVPREEMSLDALLGAILIAESCWLSSSSLTGDAVGSTGDGFSE
jgi:hypothetical protein